ncbi:PREDICTED: uncharacterized protein LOC104588434 [Nelumbo nucifera]|uniref:Uncharacterized protein LOC104588434 n=2 Tax=Nelumbo nucifera TaxID=4432 RepID=A0A1U7Z216_NELNU|nr:PREDICTED: uncharacterized protein LOC104588434 [Nelumbo nucifera]DAD37898.1 TPA_asm: hypothetical protein HUJ06_008539 [Nelumbo nucifera]
MEWRQAVDASAFFLVEATGDSDSTHCDPLFAAGLEVLSPPDDDAESCTLDSCNGTGTDCVDNTVCVDELNDFGGEESKDGNGDDDVDEYEDDGFGLSDKIASEAESRMKDKDAKVGVDADGELMNEMEKNRLFWETCLAT